MKVNKLLLHETMGIIDCLQNIERKKTSNDCLNKFQKCCSLFEVSLHLYFKANVGILTGEKHMRDIVDCGD